MISELFDVYINLETITAKELLLRQVHNASHQFLFNAGNALNHNANDPTALQFSALISRDNLENYRANGDISRKTCVRIMHQTLYHFRWNFPLSLVLR